MAGARRNRTWMTWLWLLLATVLAHATLPVGSPLARANGSPFSISTSDVSLGPSRKQAVGKASLEQRRKSDRDDAADPPASGLVAEIAALPRIRPVSHAPAASWPATAVPLDDTQSGIFRARAPPSI